MIVKPRQLPDNFAIAGYAAGNLILYKFSKEKGEIRITDRQFDILNAFTVEHYRYRKTKLYAGGKSIFICALNEGKSITFYSLDGSIVQKLDGRYIGGVFDANGNFWCAERIDNEEIRVTVFSDKLAQTASLSIEDELFKSDVIFSDIQKLGGVFMEMLAGQDGSITVLLKLNKGNIEQERPFEDDIFSVKFNHDRSFYLAIGENGFKYYSYPQHTLWRECDLSKITPDDYHVGHSVIHIAGDIFIVSHSDRYWLYEGKEAKIIDELVIEGHEARPACEIYPNLADDATLVTDITAMNLHGELIVIHADAGDVSPRMLFIRRVDIVKELRL